jgi:MFS transporter, DHA1 family, multidrug resistance protein
LARRNRYIILILGALTTISPFTIDMYLPAFSKIAADFHTTPARISLSVTSYFIGLAIGQLLYGPLLDRFGRRAPLYTGLSFYVVACIGCMQSTTIEMLVVFRFIQAIGGCVALVAAMAMVRDFFPVEQSVKVFSLLILILGLSPLLAPTFGGFITVWLGWKWIFIVLSIIVILIMLVTFFFLPVGYYADPSVSLKAKPMLLTFASVLKEPLFYTYSFAGAFSFASLFIYVAGSAPIFLEIFQLSPQAYGAVFASLSVGFIGGSQLNNVLLKKYNSGQVFRFALLVQVINSLVFLLLAINGMTTLPVTIGMFFIMLTCIGLINPNANALALSPFTRNIGSASALIGSIQIGIAGIASAAVGLFNSSTLVPIVAMLAATSLVSITILQLGARSSKLKAAGTSGPTNILH